MSNSESDRPPVNGSHGARLRRDLAVGLTAAGLLTTWLVLARGAGWTDCDLVGLMGQRLHIDSRPLNTLLHLAGGGVCGACYATVFDIIGRQSIALGVGLGLLQSVVTATVLSARPTGAWVPLTGYAVFGALLGAAV